MDMVGLEVKHFEGGVADGFGGDGGHAGIVAPWAAVFEARLAIEAGGDDAMAIAEGASPTWARRAKEHQAWGADGGGHVDGAGVVGDKQMAARENGHRLRDGCRATEVGDAVAKGRCDGCADIAVGWAANYGETGFRQCGGEETGESGEVGGGPVLRWPS